MEEGNYERRDFGNKFGGRKPMRKQFGPIPVKEGDTYDVEIEGIGDKGDGIAKVQGYVIVIPNVKKGDRVKIKINAVRGRVSFGEVIGQAESAPEEKPEEPAAEPEEEPEEGPEGEAGDVGEDEEN